MKLVEYVEIKRYRAHHRGKDVGHVSAISADGSALIESTDYRTGRTQIHTTLEQAGEHLARLADERATSSYYAACERETLPPQPLEGTVIEWRVSQ